MVIDAAPSEALRVAIAMPLAVGLSSASTSFVVPGPESMVLFGVAVPVLSALFGVVGVVLGQILAPGAVPPLGRRRRAALVTALIGLALGIVIACSVITGKAVLPLVAMGWGIGLGFSGLAAMQALGDQALGGVKRVGGELIDSLVERAGGTKKDSGNE
jgi:hypothetical protein